MPLPCDLRCRGAPPFLPTLHVVIPFYNEAGTLTACVRRVAAAPRPDGWRLALALIDDHSHPEGRAAVESLARELRTEGLRVCLRRHDVNRGKGAALQTGFDTILGGDPPDTDLVIIQDADLEYDPADYHRLIERLLAGRADVVIGSRWQRRRLAGFKVRLHRLANRGLTALSNLATGYHLSDMECCYKLFTVPTLRRMRPWLSEARFGIEPQIVATLARLGARVEQVSIGYEPRSASEGKKIGWIDGLRALAVIARERFKGRSPASPPRPEHTGE